MGKPLHNCHNCGKECHGYYCAECNLLIRFGINAVDTKKYQNTNLSKM